jgi:hypothetical protein
MNDTITPPRPSGVHDVAVQLHSDGAWYATCRTCRWASLPAHSERTATIEASLHHQAVAPQPKKRPSAVRIILVTTAVIFGVAFFASMVDTATTTHTVVYKVGGTATQADITYEGPNGDTAQQSNVDVPLTRVSDGGEGMILKNMRSGDFLYISAQNQNDSGTITCSIEIDGRVVETNTSYGGFTIATCSRRL